MNLIDSLQYAPAELLFGTSGLRGLVTDMTDLECYICTTGFLEFLALYGRLALGESVYLAGDLRDSTPRVQRAVVAAVRDAGYRPVNCGKIPTPALAYYARQENAPCIMITGSHIPADRNGIKFYKRGGEVLVEDEAAISKAVQGARDKIYSQGADRSPFDERGMLRSPPDLGLVDESAARVYERRYLDVFASDSLAGERIVVYQQSTVVRDQLVTILRGLGAEVVAVERADEFIPIDTENITNEQQDHFRALSRQHPDAFAIVSADGDADRPIVIDETGTFRRGDMLGCVVASYLGAKFAAIPITSNDAADTYLAAHHVAVTKTKVGSPYVIAGMMTATSAKRPAVAWEVNGGFLLADDVPMSGHSLKALPTRDAVLPILCGLVAATRAGSVSKLFNELPKRYTSAGLMNIVPTQKIQALREALSNSKQAIQLSAKLNIEGELGPVISIDTTDGLRLRFASSEVLHFRLSGNAPQFRVYTNADSQERADVLVASALNSRGYARKLLSLAGA